NPSCAKGLSELADIPLGGAQLSKMPRANSINVPEFLREFRVPFVANFFALLAGLCSNCAHEEPNYSNPDAGGDQRLVHRCLGSPESRRYGARFHAEGERRSDLLAIEAAGEDRRPGVVPQSVHRWVNGRMQSPP